MLRLQKLKKNPNFKTLKILKCEAWRSVIKYCETLKNPKMLSMRINWNISWIDMFWVKCSNTVRIFDIFWGSEALQWKNSNNYDFKILGNHFFIISTSPWIEESSLLLENHLLSSGSGRISSKWLVVQYPQDPSGLTVIRHKQRSSWHGNWPWLSHGFSTFRQ